MGKGTPESITARVALALAYLDLMPMMREASVTPVTVSETWVEAI